MTFKELPSDIQRIGAHALRHHIENGYHEDRIAVGLAKDIKAAFVELFSDGSTTQNIEGAAGAIAQHITFNLSVTEPRTYLTGEEAIEIASEILPAIREAINRKGVNGDRSHCLAHALNTMVASVG